MNTITRYQANDGSEWQTIEEAAKRDHILQKVDSIMSLLPKIPDDTNFTNGHGYLLCNPLNVENAKYLLRKLCENLTGKHANNIHVAGLYLDGTPAAKIYYRLQSIDHDSRMWGQPFFASNPTKGEQIKLN